MRFPDCIHLISSWWTLKNPIPDLSERAPNEPRDLPFVPQNEDGTLHTSLRLVDPKQYSRPYHEFVHSGRPQVELNRQFTAYERIRLIGSVTLARDDVTAGGDTW